jgi:23S rRNA pseudouridine1911/1915/1917 synthase
LDKETSGCLIIAKTENAFYKLQAEFKDRVVSKKYIALVHGILKSDSGEVDAAVGRLPWRRDRFGVLAGGRQANTFYKVLEQYKDYSLVKFEPHTGRTHQIRIHAKHLGHAIVSDAFYAGRKTARKDRLWCPRLFLHAGYINFIDPDTEKRVEVNSPLPRELQDVLDSLEKSELTR